MAFAPISGGTASGQSKASSNSVVTGVFGATIPADSLVLVLVAKDNVQTADGQTSEVTSVTDTKGNTYSPVIEFCNGQGGAAAGATASLWCSRTTVQLTTSDTVTANLSSAVTAKGVTAIGYTKGAGTTISFTGTGTLANDGADPGSLASSGLSAGTEYLTFRGMALEAVNTIVTPTSGWTGFFPLGAATSGGSATTNMAAEAEYKIASGATSQTSDPTVAAVDSASVIASFYEVTPLAFPPINPNRAFQPLLIR